MATDYLKLYEQIYAERSKKNTNHDRRKNIICISQTTWHGEFTKSTVQLLSLLAEKKHNCFCRIPFHIKDVVMSFTETKAW
jgi:sulfite reductase alpha subunit-like flavoprotein